MPAKHDFNISIDDGKKFDNRFEYVGRGFCLLCGKHVGQMISFRRMGPLEETNPPDEMVEVQMFEMLKKNHWPKCTARRISFFIPAMAH